MRQAFNIALFSEKVIVEKKPCMLLRNSIFENNMVIYI